jgi:MFS transporter, SET family, sugar efflux transporter
MNTQLHLPAGLSGAIIGIQPLVEIVLMLVAVIDAHRTGRPIGLFAGQFLIGGV